MAKKRTARKQITVIEKSIKGFLADEDGFVSKETILKVGLATAAGLGVVGAASAQSTHTNLTCPTVDCNQATPDSAGTCYKIVHQNGTGDHASHTAY